ncbi:MAG: sugar ABC transporter permease, partial [Clostridia bacterium]|nr:sugar ABC transporter permease [Clostridia bacterium]
MIDEKTTDQSVEQETPVQTGTPVTAPASAYATNSAPLRTVKTKFLDKIKFDSWKGWIYLLPALVLLAIFTVWPIINTVRIAFLEDYNSLGAVGGETYNFGFSNFVTVFTTELPNGGNFRTALTNTLLVCVITVPLSTFLALLIAVCLNAIKPLQKAFQTIFFLPYVTNSIAIGMVFAAVFDVVGDFNKPDLVESWGFINNIIMAFGGKPVNWIDGLGAASYWPKLFVLIVYIIWNALPFKILILLGGLQSVNKQYYEAAQIDSTPRWRVFTKITVPLLSPMLAYVIITGFIGGFKEYSSIIGIFGDKMGPADDAGRLNTMVGFVYDALER